ncbi:MAG: hypothetical protein ACYCPH_00430 [Minisyncoccota bacterium]
MKGFLLGILLVLLIGVGGFAYRSAVEYSTQPIACPLDAEICPDGTSVSRTGLSCTFPACPPPNVSLASVNIAFAIPPGFLPVALPDPSSVAAYGIASTSSSGAASIVIRRYSIDASSTALAVIQQTAINPASGTPAPVTAFSSTFLGTHRFTVVSLERSGGVVDTAYYLARGGDVLRFDAIDTGVANWNDPNLDTSILPARAALRKLLSTLVG